MAVVLVGFGFFFPTIGRKSLVLRPDLSIVMAGLDPAIHVLTLQHREGVDARVKPGHDDCK
jgi:hypothetical protein